MTKTKLTAIITATLAATVLLTGCTQPAPKPTHSTATHTATPTAAPTQAQVEPPSSTDAAYAAANKTIDGFFATDAAISAAPEKGADAMAKFATGTALANEQSIAAQLAEKKWYVTGPASSWTPNPSLSSYGEVKNNTTGTVYNNAIAYMKGCLDLSGRITRARAGATAKPSDSPDKMRPLAITVQWTPNTRTWLVTDLTSVTGTSGVPQC